MNQRHAKSLEQAGKALSAALARDPHASAATLADAAGDAILATAKVSKPGIPAGKPSAAVSAALDRAKARKRQG